MRDDQHIRRIAYIAFGAVPAVVMSIFALFMADPATCVGALTGMAGLCAATLARMPPDSPNIRLPIAIALIIGLVTMAFWGSLFGYLFVSDLMRGDPEGNPTTSIFSILGQALFWTWVLI